MRKLLVVEGDPDCITTARDYFSGITDFEGVYAVNLDEAVRELGSLGRNGCAMVDCFFASGDDGLSRGYAAIRMLQSLNPQKYEPIPSGFAQTQKLTPIGGARVDLSPESYISAIEIEMLRDQSKQPLGIIIGEKLYERHLPFVLTTSTNHNDEVAMPIQNYANGRGWALVDCPPGNPQQKTNREFWERALSVLRRM